MPEDRPPQPAPSSKGAKSVLDWTSVDKCILVLAITFGFAAFFSAMLEYYFRHEEWAPYMNRARWGTNAAPMWAEAAVLAVLAAAGFLLRKHSPVSAVYVNLTNHAVWLNNVFYCYMIGYYTTPIGITFLGAAFASFLFFGLRPVFYAMGTSIVAMGAMSYLERAGVIPYAHLLRTDPFGPDGRLYASWVFAAGVPGLAFTVVIIWLCTFTIARWREREEKLAEAYGQLRQAKDQLVRAESLAAVGSLVTGAAHELRNPLSSSGALFQSLKDDIAASSATEAQKQDALATIGMALKGQKRAALIAERLYQLTDDLVAHKSTASLGESLEAFSRSYPGLRIALPPELRVLRVAEGLVQTVIPNLLDNAVAAGGPEPPILLAEQAGGALRLSVTDSGRGIPQPIQGEVFKPFFTGQKAGEGHGVGLGLYIVHELVARMGGSVVLESEEGKGTRVTVTVPLSNPPAL